MFLGDRAQRVGGVESRPGSTMQAPWLVAPRLPITMPKQWYSGTGRQTRSSSVQPCTSATK